MISVEVSNDSTPIKKLLDSSNLPIFRDHPHLGLLIAGPQHHANPILSRCTFTACSRSATLRTCCGIGVS